MGYRLVIVPGVLLKTIVEACDAALGELKQTQLAPAGTAIGVHELFQRFGAAEWDPLRVKQPQQFTAKAG
jgi:hypothetical protein